jgi:hypothetical protein
VIRRCRVEHRRTPCQRTCRPRSVLRIHAEQREERRDRRLGDHREIFDLTATAMSLGCKFWDTSGPTSPVRANKNPRFTGVFRADDGTRTHDLLHGKDGTRPDSNRHEPTNDLVSRLCLSPRGSRGSSRRRRRPGGARRSHARSESSLKASRRREIRRPRALTDERG